MAFPLSIPSLESHPYIMSFLGDLVKKTQETVEKQQGQIPTVFVPSPNAPSLERTPNSDAIQEALDKLMRNKYVDVEVIIRNTPS